MTERVTKPKHSMTVRTYAELDQVVAAFGDNKLNLVILVGPAGVAKSQTVQRRVGDRACWIEGNATPFAMYQALYHKRNQPVVIDDVDNLYANKSAVRLLKCVCQTNPVKTVMWHSASSALQSEGVPREFTTTSRLMIIANEWKSMDANVLAIEDRAHFLYFEPSAEEVHLQVANWFWDQQIFDWFADHLHLIPNHSMRSYVRASELKEAGLDWVRVLLSESIPEKALLIAKLKGDPRFSEERERVAEFARLGGGGQTTWYKWSRRIRSPKSVAALKPRLSQAVGYKLRNAA